MVTAPCSRPIESIEDLLRARGLKRPMRLALSRVTSSVCMYSLRRCDESRANGRKPTARAEPALM